MRQAVAMVLALGLASCAATMGGSGRSPVAGGSIAAEPAEGDTQARLTELHRQAAMARAEIRLLRQSLAALQMEVERLSAEAERSVPAPPEAFASQSAFESADLEPVRVEPQVVPLPPEPELERIPPTPAGPDLPPTAVPLAGQAIYDRGYTLYHQGRYVDAESSFQRFLQAHADTELADNAQFWIGESRFARGDYMAALLAFQEVLDRHQGGNKVADALLKVGDCLVRLDNRAAGEERYEEVLRRFPGSAAAVMAEERLGRSSD
jgi:tol-pal system protein YbgF